MNAFKKYVRSKGVMLENDYECLPSPDGIDTVVVHADKAMVATYHYVVGWVYDTFNRDGSVDTSYDIDKQGNF